MPRYALLILYRSYILPLLDYGDVIYDNISTADSCRLENVQATAAKLILGCMQTTSHLKILNELSMSPLHLRRNCHILFAFHKILLGPCPTFLATLTPKFFRDLSNHSLRHVMNVELPSCRTVLFHSSFFKSLNYSLCSCGLSQTEIHILLECDLTRAPRQVMLNSIRNILLKEQVFTLSQQNILSQAAWKLMLLFGHAKLKRPSILQLYNLSLSFNSFEVYVTPRVSCAGGSTLFVNSVLSFFFAPLFIIVLLMHLFSPLYVDFLLSCCCNWSQQMALQVLACCRLPLNKIKYIKKYLGVFSKWYTVALPAQNFGEGKFFDFKLATVFCFGHPTQMHKMKSYARNWGAWPVWTPEMNPYVNVYTQTGIYKQQQCTENQINTAVNTKI